MSGPDIVERLRRLPPSPIAFGDSEADKRNRAEREEAADEIERLRELLRSEGANRYWEGRWRDLNDDIEQLKAKLNLGTA